jgi:hypothetical protein
LSLSPAGPTLSNMVFDQLSLLVFSHRKL